MLGRGFSRWNDDNGAASQRATITPMLRRAEQIPRWCKRLVDLADSDPARAVGLAHKTPISKTTPWHQFAQGWALLCWERFAAARAALTSARHGFATVPAPLGSLLCEYGLLVVDMRQLVRQGLDEELAALADQLTEAGELSMATRARLDQARQLNVLGRTRESEAVLDRLERAEPACPPLALARLRRVRAVAAYLQGDYPRAVALLDEVERWFRKARRRIELARCWFEQAAVASYQERLDVTLAYCERAGRVFVEFDLPLQRAFCLKVAGFASIRQGRYDQALLHTRQALDLFQALGHAHDVGACTLNLGNIYFHSASWAAALGAYTRAEERFVAAGMLGHELVAQRNRAMVYRAMGRLPEAWALLTEAGQKAARLGHQAEVAEVWAVQAALLADEARMPEAIRRYREAYERFVQLENMTAAGECRLELGWLELRAANISAAAAHFAAASPALARRDHHSWRVRYGQARCAELSDDPATALQHYGEASRTVAALRQRLASERLSSQLFAQAHRLHADALLLAGAQNDPLAALTFAEGQRALTLQQLVGRQAAALSPADQVAHEELRQQIEALLDRGEQAWEALDAALEAYDQLLLRIQHTDHGLADTGLIEPAGTFDVSSVRQAFCAALGDAWTCLIYSCIDDRLLTISLTPDNVTLDWQPYDDALQRLLDRASQPMYRYYTYSDIPFAQGQSSRRWAGQTALAERLLPAQVSSRLAPDHRLLIIPWGPLHLVPWGALRLDECWLTERAVIQLLPSLTLASRLFQHSAPGAYGLIVGCSSFRGRANDLPAVAAELAIVAERWPGPCSRRLDQQATRAAVLSALTEAEQKPGLLHLASHAQLLPSRGLAAHVKLWDGNLLLTEISRLDLAGALVILSACDGAAADVLPGEEVLSLTWAFLAGGAGGVIASLWPLSDQVAPVCMERLYEQLGDGRDAALALAHAQRALIRGEGVDGPCGPQVWAALQLVGGPAARG